MDSLLKNISTYTDEEIKDELVRLIVSINDSHTRVGLVNNTIYPLKLYLSSHLNNKMHNV
ncbi:hypothetical protein [Clostridium tertium]|uniref:hypothetical protein n=1 Tax=Clostridium tertium TaxID=1559 RepID=UPI001AE61665|nr:hypothetical protein [Clostridium tertium]MBP1867566.1 hypothetical protein [Clostridium tertium]